MDFKLISSEQLAESYGTSLHQEQYRYSDGTEVGRTVVRRPDAAAVVVKNENGEVIMIRQPREAVGESECLEIPAGKIDEGETPLEAAQRELVEEIGVVASSWTDLGFIYASPGYSAERIYLFAAEGLTYQETSFDSDERIETETMSFTEAISQCNDGKSLVALLKFERS